MKKRRWLDVRSVSNIDIQSLTYDRTWDRYLAWAEDYGNEDNLLFISGTGELLSRENIKDRLKGFYQLYDRGNDPIPLLEIVTQGNNIALIAREGNIFTSKTDSNNSIQAIWHYDLDSNVIQLTYKSN